LLLSGEPKNCGVCYAWGEWREAHPWLGRHPGAVPLFPPRPGGSCLCRIGSGSKVIRRLGLGGLGTEVADVGKRMGYTERPRRPGESPAVGEGIPMGADPCWPGQSPCP
jgi:hypothetical protein